MSEEKEHSDFGIYLSLDQFRSNGLLYLVNKRVFHPMGMALAVNCDDEGNVIAEAPFILLGDGVETWNFVPETDRMMDLIWNDFRKFFRAAAAGEVPTTDIADRGVIKENNDGTENQSDSTHD